MCTETVCTCPYGTTTVSAPGGGSGGTLCESSGVDCSACDHGYRLSEAAATGSQTCEACPAIVGGVSPACTIRGNTQVASCAAVYVFTDETGGAVDVCMETVCTCPYGTAMVSADAFMHARIGSRCDVI